MGAHRSLRTPRKALRAEDKTRFAKRVKSTVPTKLKPSRPGTNIRNVLESWYKFSDRWAITGLRGRLSRRPRGASDKRDSRSGLNQPYRPLRPGTNVRNVLESWYKCSDRSALTGLRGRLSRRPRGASGGGVPGRRRWRGAGRSPDPALGFDQLCTSFDQLRTRVDQSTRWTTRAFWGADSWVLRDHIGPESQLREAS